MCTFDPGFSDQIHGLLRKPVRAKGEAKLQPHTDRLESLHIQEIEPLPSLDLGEGNFFAAPSIVQLAQSQKIKPLTDMSVLAGGFPSDENIDDFLEEIYSERRQE